MSKNCPPCQCKSKLDHVQKTIIQYFGSIPGSARDLGYIDGEALVVMGNGLLWTSCYLDEGINFEQPIGERPISVKALSRQFQEAGREIWDFDPAKNSGIAAKIHKLEFQVKTLQRMIVLGGAK